MKKVIEKEQRTKHIERARRTGKDEEEEQGGPETKSRRCQGTVRRTRPQGKNNKQDEETGRMKTTGKGDH